jgi:DNA-binding transcriptional ArsR family regulator
MARAATTTDAFNAVAEPRRRQILDVIAGTELSVTDLVRRLGLPQPLVSKHLRVLRETGLVVARDDGRQRLYRLNGPALLPIYDWVCNFEQLWSQRFARMDAVLADLRAAGSGDTGASRAGTDDGDGRDDDD